MSDWQPPADLSRLLEALAKEINSATDVEVTMAGVDSAGHEATAQRETRARVVRLRELTETAIEGADTDGDSRPQLRIVEGEGACELRHRPH